MEPKIESESFTQYWKDQKEYFKEKTIAFKELKKKREIEIIKDELYKNKNHNNNNERQSILLD